MFGGVYDDAPAPERQVYGSLNHRRRPAGGSVRFGSAHLRLRGEVRDRLTFCYRDSVERPTVFGTAAHLPLPGPADRSSPGTSRRWCSIRRSAAPPWRSPQRVEPLWHCGARSGHAWDR
ncbi:DUF3626 domain-containing protein [Litorihabitans aurantiacus]|uniref:Uncharacterized protein n=1 Tax=Litorihabitans aurantiacus TaxID=1930061 RepID=A0AA38CNX9_9MICO|nr:DUF3626 domain-containing protein [Litorihabitans aurantiacus]GMA31538.1 hypothetical protein GCM10025875_15300 [Litorihabitans aurantiacus]